MTVAGMGSGIPEHPIVSKTSNLLIAVPLAVLAASLSYPAAGRHAVVLASPVKAQGAAIGWLAARGARVSARTKDGGVVLELPTDALAMEAMLAGILLVSAPDHTCATEERA